MVTIYIVLSKRLWGLYHRHRRLMTMSAEELVVEMDDVVWSLIS
jgi:hypothetical protein